MTEQGFLMRLRRDTRGNTLALMAAALVPLLGFAGSAIDMARLYVIKTRLQQACDAGVLAGRKAMSDSNPSTDLDGEAKKQAEAFFKNNFPAGWYQTKTVDFIPVKSIDGEDSTVANAVRGEAKATVPMAVMGFFGFKDRPLVVTCQARFDLSDTDVMFVLDTTGSMGCVPSAGAGCGGNTVPYTRGDLTPGLYAEEAPGSKMQGLRDAVLLFDETMRANADTTTKVRYGFVTYSSSVNVGKIIPAQYLQSTTYTYNSRRLSPTNNGDYDYLAPIDFSYTNVPQAYCVNTRVPASGFTLTGPTWGDEGYFQARRFQNMTWTAANNGTCTGKQQRLRALWRYEPVALDVSGFAASIQQGFPAVTVPGRLDGLTSRWRGCIEEVNTTASTSFSASSLPDDLDPDFKPSAADNKWRPAWPEVTWLRGSVANYVEKYDHDITELKKDESGDWEEQSFRPGMVKDYQGAAACGMPARTLAKMERQDVIDYVTHVDFKPFGGTYHDAGMIWGARMISPDGVFAQSTAAHAGRNDPTRSIVFMTDGVLSTNFNSMGMYGPEQWNRRVSGGDLGSLNARHTERFKAVCDAAKSKGVTIYVVAFGASVGISDDLRYCASPGQAFPASDTAALKEAFVTIARRVASLRITQ